MNNLTIDDNHIYRLDNVAVPGVTAILFGAGIVDLSAIPAAQLLAAQEFGTAVHLACELADKETLDEGALDPNLRPYLDGWKLFRQEYNFAATHIEQMMYSRQYRFAGTIDRIGRWRIDDSLLIVDIKSGAESPAIAIQIAGYELLARDNFIIGKRKIKRIAVMLNSGGGYKIKEYKDKNDVNVFLAALSVFNWQRKNNGK